MAERIKIWQDNNFRTKIWAPPSQEPESKSLNEVMHIHELTPYGMLLASLGECTGFVLHTYAQHHNIALKEVDFALQYNRTFKNDCEDCENIEKYEEQINLQMSFKGTLTLEQKDKLFAISKQCPIHKMFEHGIETNFKLIEGS